MKNHDKISLELYNSFSEEQNNSVLNQNDCDIEPTFLGFVGVYKNLSEIIPKHFTIIDLGCAYAPQCFYFKDHAKYIGVDVFNGIRYYSENSIHVIDEIGGYIDNLDIDLDLKKVFAICSYVPDWYGDVRLKARNKFSNLFVFYPA